MAKGIIEGFFFNKWFLIGAVIIVIWLLGGASIITSNPIIFVFGLFILLFMFSGGKKRK